ncbi:Sulfur carrier protein CysO [Rosistilla ulvae]|uniref:Sulfur carrier protein CysO n=1 Tax=Rosistilla ulvae TaxID=1930277 RepID=A0A517LYV7_9BACT|nr:MoaD/ThiS family protein [Rosistilla ulvae]QDS87806.1 Sulfur carrier protein CysO [Rosistilla ulvae]
MNVIIPTSLRQHTGGLGIVDVQGLCVDEALLSLVESHPALKPQLLDASGDILSHVNVFVNDTNARDMDAGATPLAESDEILLVPAIAGG